MESPIDENDRVMRYRNEVDRDVQTPQNDIENDCDAIQQPSTSKNLLLGVPNISTNVHVYSESRPGGDHRDGAASRLVATHMGIIQSDFKNDDVDGRQARDW